MSLRPCISAPLSPIYLHPCNCVCLQPCILAFLDPCTSVSVHRVFLGPYTLATVNTCTPVSLHILYLCNLAACTPTQIVFQECKCTANHRHEYIKNYRGFSDQMVDRISPLYLSDLPCMCVYATEFRCDVLASKPRPINTSVKTTRQLALGG